GLVGDGQRPAAVVSSSWKGIHDLGGRLSGWIVAGTLLIRKVMLFLRRLVALVGTLCLASAISPNRHDDWCASVEASVVLDVDEQERLDRAAIEAHPVCIGSR